MAFDTYLFINTVDGESTADFPTKPNGLSSVPMELMSYSFGASNPTTIGTQGGGSSAGKVSISSFNVMKRSDKASPLLFQACCNGEHYDKASVVLRKAGGAANKQQIFVQYDFEEVFVESIQWSGSGGGDDVPMESVSFSFGKVAITYFGQDKTGKVAKQNEAAWDLRTAKA